MASAVWGQPDFASGHCHKAASRTLCGPAQAVEDGKGDLFVADFANNRVVMYPPDSHVATKVFGQYGSFATNHCNERPPRGHGYPAAPSRYTLCQPVGVAVDAKGTLYVADSINNRVLVYFHAARKPASAPADRVLGQSGFHASASNDLYSSVPACPAPRPASRCTLNGPMEISIDSRGDLLVPDFDNNRVLLWSAASLARLKSPACAHVCVMPASRVWGQYGSFSTNVANNPAVPASRTGVCTNISFSHPASACTLSGPWTAVADRTGNLFISDTDNNRLLEYAHALTDRAQNATGVYGQAGNVRTSIGNLGGISAASLWHPIGLALDPSGDLWTTDFYNGRVLEFPPSDATDADRAINVLGQNGRFDTQTCAVTRESLCGPTSITFDKGGNAFVVDGLNSRLLEYAASNP